MQTQSPRNNTQPGFVSFLAENAKAAGSGEWGCVVSGCRGTLGRSGRVASVQAAHGGLLRGLLLYSVKAHQVYERCFKKSRKEIRDPVTQFSGRRWGREADTASAFRIKQTPFCLEKGTVQQP